MSTEKSGVLRAKSFAALRYPSFRLYWTGSLFSRIADNMDTVIRTWVVWELTHSPVWLGLMVFCHWIPTTLLAPLSGVLADRYDNRKIVLFSEVLYVLSSLGMGILTLAGVVQAWHIAALLLLHGLSGALSQPSRQVLIHDMVGKEDLLSGVSLTSTLFQTAQSVGPAIGGVLIAVVGPGLAFLINAGAFLPAIFSLIVLRVEKKHTSHAWESPWKSFYDGWKHLVEQPFLAGLVVLGTLPALLIGNSMNSMMPIFATDILHVGPQGLGLLLSANGVGSLLAAFFLSYLGSIGRKGLLIVASSLAYGLVVAAFGVSSWYLLSLLLLAIIGALSVASNTLINTTLQLAAPDRLRGRIMGIFSFGTLGVLTFNGPLVGGIAAMMGISRAMILLGVLIPIVTVITLAKVPGLYSMD